MVSTRQMATSSGQGFASNSNNNNNNNTNSSIIGNEEFAGGSAPPLRASVVTRQYSSNVMTISNVALTRHHAQSLQTANNNNKLPTGVTNTSNNFGNEVVEEEEEEYVSTLHLHDLPLEILIKILSYESYKRLTQLRLVSHKVNEVCINMLNSTFSKLISQTYNRFQAIKANMPRRESLRRNHPLACECDIIETCYMRLSLLQMTLGKHIERGHCCFFPGSILDEVYTILNHIKNTPRLERSYRVTDELFDLSTMAMEYFRDRIEPQLPGIGYFQKDFFKMPSAASRPPLVVSSQLVESSSNSPSPPQSNMVLRKGIRKIKQGMKIYNNQLSVLRNELRTCKRKSTEQGKQIAEQQKLLGEQQKQTLEYANRLDENDKKNEEMSRKFSTLLQELNKCKTELQYWRSKSPAIASCSSCGQKFTTPALPLEDYQAIINQGVKPDDILFNLRDDVDMESSNEDKTCAVEFAYPDELTTAKLLATHTASKQLKRQHSAISNVDEAPIAHAVATTITTASQEDTCSKIGNEGVLAYCESSSSLCSDDAMANLGQNVVHNSAVSLVATPSTSLQAANGFAANIFYGNNNLSQAQLQHRGVIVNPSTFGTGAKVMELEDGVEGVHSNALPSETKKARRVQKATRCLNASGKRSK